MADESIASGVGDGRQVGCRTDGGLPTGGFIGFVIQDDMDEIARPAGGDEGEGAEAHQSAAVPLDDPDRPRRRLQGQAEPQARQQPHRADHVEISRAIANSEGLTGNHPGGEQGHVVSAESL